MIRNTPVSKITLPQIDEDKWQNVRSYLVDELKINPQLVDKLHCEGMIYADMLQNLVCLHRSINNNTILRASRHSTTAKPNINTNPKKVELLSFTRESHDNPAWFFFKIGEDAKGEEVPIVLASSPLEALAIATRDAFQYNTIYISIYGSRPPMSFLRSQRKQPVFIALNNETRSEAMAQEIKRRLHNKTIFMRPNSIDWVM